VPWELVSSASGWRAVAERLQSSYPDGAVFGLEGPLGVGKTTFVREFVGMLCEAQNTVPPRVISPSYVLHQKYEVGRTVDHFDLYRLEKPSQVSLIEIGLFEALDRSDRGGYVFIEWAERLAPKDFPLKRISIRFKDAQREFLVTDGSERL
jgi:tRNA threonylcarbamoyl adenosine modification protein YjeE